MSISYTYNPFTNDLDALGPGSGGGGSILTINHIAPDGTGNFTVSAGPGINITPEVNGIQLAATEAAFAYTNVTHAMSPYSVLSTDYYLSVDCSAGTVRLNFPNVPTAFADMDSERSHRECIS